MEGRERKRSCPWKWLLLIATGTLLLTVIWIGWLHLQNEYYLQMDLAGEQEIFLKYGEPFEDPGVTLWFWGSHLCRKGMSPEIPVQVDSQLELSRLGRYSITYSAGYRDCQATAQRIVWVVDTQGPVIELESTREEPLLHGERYEEEGFRAYDNYDGDITHRVVRTEKAGGIIYSVADSSGNPCYAYREIPYYDPIPPEIHLAGDGVITLNTGIPFQDPGFTAWDNVDGDLTGQVAVEGEVIFHTPGSYPIHYKVQDSYGNVTEVVRMVTVQGHPAPEIRTPQGKVIYLTFDDGPGPHTYRLLEVLDRYGVKATFFVVDSDMDWLLKEITDRGHSIGVHSMTHEYGEIYASPEAFFADLYGMQEKIYQTTGVQTNLMRFPGGGSNTVSISNPGIMTLLTRAVGDAGFRYFDWNVDSNDAGGAKTANTVRSNIITGIQSQQISVVLQHDIHGYSVDAVEELIQWGLDNGYTFLPLDMSSPICQHDVRN